MAGNKGCNVLGWISLALMMLGLGYCFYRPFRDPASESATSTNASIRAWQEVAQWSGTGTKTTETFRVAGDEWRIKWSFQPQASSMPASLFQVYVYRAGDDLPISLAANETGTAREDVSYVHAGPGSYYITMTAANAVWAVIVEEER